MLLLFSSQNFASEKCWNTATGPEVVIFSPLDAVAKGTGRFTNQNNQWLEKLARGMFWHGRNKNWRIDGGHWARISAQWIWARTGVNIGPVLLIQLLINIFRHNTPLRDGASDSGVAIGVAATCYLPRTNQWAEQTAWSQTQTNQCGELVMVIPLTVCFRNRTGSVYGPGWCSSAEGSYSAGADLQWSEAPNKGLCQLTLASVVLLKGRRWDMKKKNQKLYLRFAKREMCLFHQFLIWFIGKCGQSVRQ